MKKKTIYNIIALSLMIGLLSCGQDQNDIKQDTSDPITVSVLKVTASNENTPIVVSGTIESSNSANLSTRMMGHVEKVKVEIGDKVSKGQVLLIINNSDLQAQSAQVNAGISEAEAAFAIAEKDYNRYKNLFQQESASQKELDDVTAHYNMAKARLESAKQMKKQINAQYAYSNIKAPFSGTITAKFIDEGALANPGMPLLAMESTNNFEVSARIPEEVISDIKDKMKVNITISSINTSLKGTIKEVSSSSKHSGGQYLVKISLDESNEQLRSGMFATVQLPRSSKNLSENGRTILIPQNSIITNGQLSGVYSVSQQQTAVLRWLRLGKTIGDNVEVLSGLIEGETIITSSESKIYNGSKLNLQ